MHPRVVVTIALVLALLGTLFNVPQRTAAAAAASRPDIVLFYIDDLAPYPNRQAATHASDAQVPRQQLPVAAAL